MSSFAVSECSNGVRFSVKVIPRASRSEVFGVRDGALVVKLTAPPVDGAANEALIALLAAELRIAKRDVRIVRGQSGRNKVVEVAATHAQVLMLLPSA